MTSTVGKLFLTRKRNIHRLGWKEAIETVVDGGYEKTRVKLVQNRYCQVRDMQTGELTMVANRMYSNEEDSALSENDGPSEAMPEATSCNICTASIEKRIKMEYAWQLWVQFSDSFSRYQDWLEAAEMTLDFIKSSQLLYVDAKKELKKCELLKRHVRERLEQLESLNRQYRRLGQMNGIGLQERLRTMVQECNQRWDSLHKQTSAIHKRLKYFVSQREEFESEREFIEVWLIELDLRLTDVEHFSCGNTLAKIKQLQPMQQDVQLNADRVDGLLVLGEQLIQRCEPLDAQCLEEELQVLSCYCQEIFKRIFRLYRRLVFQDELQLDKESDQESDSISDVSLEQSDDEEDRGKGVCLAIGSDESHHLPHHKVCIRHRITSAKRDSVDLEWDPSVDVGGSTSYDDDDSFHSAFTGIFPFEELKQKHRTRCRRRKGTGSELKVLLCHRKRCKDFINSRRVSDSDLELHSNRNFRFTEGMEQPQGFKTQRFIMNGSCCKSESSTFDSEHIETWLGQTCTSTSLEVPQRCETETWPPSSQKQRFGPTEYETNNNSNYCSKQHNTCQQLKQLTSTPSMTKVNNFTVPPHEKMPLRKQNLQCSEEPVLSSEKRNGVLLQPSFPEKSTTFRKSLILHRLTTLALVSILFAVLFVTGICVLYVLDSSCHQANRMAWSRHFMLTYVNGPPPT